MRQLFALYTAHMAWYGRIGLFDGGIPYKNTPDVVVFE
jgi:hypothetical protein